MASGSRGTFPQADERAGIATDLALGLWHRLTKHQTERALQAMVALLHNGEEIGLAQFNAAHLALERHRSLLQRLEQADSAAQLLELQAEFWRLDHASLVRYWQDMFNAGARLGAEIWRCQRAMLPAGQSETVRTAFQVLQNSLHTGLPPFDDVLEAPSALEPGAPSGYRPH